MYVCICNGVTEQEIRDVAAAGCRTLAELTMRTGCGSTCGCCLDEAGALLEEVRASREATPALELPLLTHAA